MKWCPGVKEERGVLKIARHYVVSVTEKKEVKLLITENETDKKRKE